MTAQDGGDAFYSSSLSRIGVWIIALGVSGTLLFGILRDLHYAGGFLLGSAASWLSFWRWRKLVERLSGAPSTGGSAWGMILRLGLLAAGAYVILKYLEVNLVAALLGLLAAAAAVVFELVYLLIRRGV